MEFRHETVLPDEVTDSLQPGPGKIFLDLTLGGGGHSERLLAKGADVVGIDRDPEALAAAGKRLAAYSTHFRALKGNFSCFPELCREAGVGPFDGILLDLGVSSHQLDTAERGFSFLREGPLDMRMGRDDGITAAELVNHATEEELARIFRDFGEEPQARRAARALVAARAKAPLKTTLELANVLESALGRKSGHHPGTRVFQALRMAVNGELAALVAALAAVPTWLRPGGRFAVISFHSLEDRLCKNHVRERARATLDRPEWPEPRANPEFCYRDLSRHPIEASAAEIARNPRARSAKLRVAEKLSDIPS
ncbi:MAG: 16S rRNA (cytosine(1402)-N(4))-methyltransferase RsmH [Verrucomicrobiales bacterium]